MDKKDRVCSCPALEPKSAILGHVRPQAGGRNDIWKHYIADPMEFRIYLPHCGMYSLSTKRDEGASRALECRPESRAMQSNG